MERSLVERARSGDRDAFEELARNRIDFMYRSAYAILGNTQDAQDATQDALTSAWRSLNGLKDPARFDAWLGRTRLTFDQRAILVGHHVDGRPLQELADILGIPVGTAKSRLFAARQALASALEAEG